MTTTNDGGRRNAFPVSEYAALHDSQAQGMSLREWYAGLAMQGLIIADLGDHKRLAGEAVAYADALLAELAKERP